MKDTGPLFFSEIDSLHSAAVASFLHQGGHRISGLAGRGSTQTAARLEGMGIEVHREWSPECLGDAAAVVAAGAGRSDVVSFARSQAIPVVSHSSVVARIAREYRTIGVTGTHGKGTVAAMIAWILERAGWEPGFLIGGFVKNFQADARRGSGEWLVVEIDESCPEFHEIRCSRGICNFLEMDHPESYRELTSLLSRMKAFFEGQAGLSEAFINLDCVGNRRLVESLEMRPTGYSLDHATEYRGMITSSVPGEGVGFEVYHRDEHLGEVKLKIPGAYNGVNALGAFSAAFRLGVDPRVIVEALSSFEGLRDRFTLSTGGQVTVVRDMVSHPTGIGAVLRSLPEASGRRVAVLADADSPLVELLGEEFVAAFQGCDEVVLLRGGAGEGGVHRAELLAGKLNTDDVRGTVLSPKQAQAYLVEILKAGDQVLFFGDEEFLAQADHVQAALAQRQAKAPVVPQPPMKGPLTDGDQ